jgi:hypothetical protein
MIKSSLEKKERDERKYGLVSMFSRTQWTRKKKEKIVNVQTLRPHNSLRGDTNGRAPYEFLSHNRDSSELLLY